MRRTIVLLGAAALALTGACQRATAPADNGMNEVNASGGYDSGGMAVANASNAAASSVIGGNASRVSFRGCPMRAQVESGCITVKSTDQVTYELYSSKPLPDPSKRLIVEGTGTTGGVSTCMVGTPLNDVDWQYTKTKCPIGGKE